MFNFARITDKRTGEDVIIPCSDQPKSAGIAYIIGVIDAWTQAQKAAGQSEHFTFNLSDGIKLQILYMKRIGPFSQMTYNTGTFDHPYDWSILEHGMRPDPPAPTFNPFTCGQSFVQPHA